MDDNRPRGLLTQLSEAIRTVKKIVEAVAAPWKITVGAILAVLMATGIVEPELPFKIIKAVLSAGSE